MLDFLPSKLELLSFCNEVVPYLFFIPFLLGYYWQYRRNKDFRVLIKKKETELGKTLPRRYLLCTGIPYKPRVYADEKLEGKHCRYCWEIVAIIFGSFLLVGTLAGSIGLLLDVQNSGLAGQELRWKGIEIPGITVE